MSVGRGFQAELVQADSAICLARAGLLFARSEYPSLDCGLYLGQLDLISSAIARRAGDEASRVRRLQHLVNYLFRELDYRGNLDDYYDPRNSFLNEVIDRRTGIPITLSIVFLEVAERLGLQAEGVSFPGHFLVNVELDTNSVIVDPFDRGAMIERGAFIARLRKRTSDGEYGMEDLDFEEVLAPATRRDVLLRLLRNLKVIYARESLQEKTLNVLNHILVVDPHQHGDRLERAGLFEELECLHAALADYAFVLDNAGPRLREDRAGAIDFLELEARFSKLRERAGALH